jgi:hypothetical protein
MRRILVSMLAMSVTYYASALSVLKANSSAAAPIPGAATASIGNTLTLPDLPPPAPAVVVSAPVGTHAPDASPQSSPPGSPADRTHHGHPLRTVLSFLAL